MCEVWLWGLAKGGEGRRRGANGGKWRRTYGGDKGHWGQSLSFHSWLLAHILCENMRLNIYYALCGIRKFLEMFLICHSLLQTWKFSINQRTHWIETFIIIIIYVYQKLIKMNFYRNFSANNTLYVNWFE